MRIDLQSIAWPARRIAQRAIAAPYINLSSVVMTIKTSIMPNERMKVVCVEARDAVVVSMIMRMTDMNAIASLSNIRPNTEKISGIRQ